MKKIIRIFSLIIFILFTLCITTSVAANTSSIDGFWSKSLYTVNEKTKPEQMIEALNDGKLLDGISGKVRDDNDYLLCRERHWAIYSTGRYELAGGTTTFPGVDSNGNGKIDSGELEENGYAKAYILAAGRDENGNDEYYIKNDDKTGDITQKDERHHAWYCILGQSDGDTPNDLYYIAMAYQNYKKSEIDMRVTVDSNAETIVNENNAVYGPIKVKYSYAKSPSKLTKSDEWGGFNYAFFNEDNLNISNKVKLCTLSEDGTYTPINSTKITSEDETNGYYKVREKTYNNKALYVVTSDKAIGTVTLKIQENSVDYEATIQPIKGEYYHTEGSMIYCSSCQNKMKNAVTSMSSAVSNSNVALLQNGNYYVYSGAVTEPRYCSAGHVPYNIYRVGGMEYKASDVDASDYEGCYFCGDCYSYVSSETHSHQYYTGYCGEHQRTGCWHCYKCDWYGTSSSHKRLTYMKKYDITVYQFTPLGCGRDMGDKVSNCGTPFSEGYHNSQGLDIITKIETKKSNKIIDIDIEFLINLDVEKVWEDENDKYQNRPSSIEVELLKNGVSTGQKLKLSSSNNWKGTFEELDVVDDSGNKITYTIKEISTPTGYITTKPTGNQNKGFVITNTLERVEVPVKKVWKDDNNRDKLRPESITVILYRDGTEVDRAILKGTTNTWTYTFKNLPKYVNNELVTYTVEEAEIPQGYMKQITGNATSGFTITNTHYAGYIEISGTVWSDGYGGKANDINGTLGTEDTLLEGIKVRLKDKDGNLIPASYYRGSGNEIEYIGEEYALTALDGTYTIRVNYEDKYSVYKLYNEYNEILDKVNSGYVEFEYDGLKYTTIATSPTGAHTSKAKEHETSRNNLDNKYHKVDSSTKIDNWTDTAVIAETKGVISFETYTDKTIDKEREETIEYCDGKGNYQLTDPNGAWNEVITEGHTCGSENCPINKKFNMQVEKIQNVNLGLFVREQPDVAIFSDLSKVEVETNGQRYTYVYGVRSNDKNNVGLQAKFQNKDTYTYKRPVNPADIAYIQEEANKNQMSVVVTYKVRVANLSTTLPITIHNITNYFDTEYTLNTNGWTVTPGTEFNQARYNGDLNITLQRGTESPEIELSYTVSLDAIRGLLNENATLNNAVEIEAYSTTYGATTLYAEQRTHEKDEADNNAETIGRAGKSYGGYDYNSHPGNAGIFINGDGRLEAAKPEDDTDIAPSFVLCKDEESKILSGTVFEDTDVRDNEERVGDGRYDASSEQNVQNVKVELYNVDGTIAKLYNNSTTPTDAIVYTNADGNYAFNGVVTGEYYIKFTYGDDTTQLANATTIDGSTTLNARNYKSTIITNDTVKNILNKKYEEFSEEEKKWHINIDDNYSIAIDNIQQRLGIEDLQYSNFEQALNMTAYSKPFKTQVEFDADGQSQVDVSGDIIDIEGKDNELSKLDFGIIERPREDLFTQKTISHIKLTLANGQVLLDGDPRTEDLNYTKAMGFKQTITNGAQARAVEEKVLLAELDAELTQGAQLEIQYEVTVTNNNEIDYDYETNQNYYYYGIIPEGESPLSTTIEYIDYMDGDNTYDEAENSDWKVVENIETYKDTLICAETVKLVKDEKYKALQSTSGASITLARKETSTPLTMKVSKMLTTQAENVYDNGVEIIKIDGKTARTIQESAGGIQIEKSYKPGNYIPTQETSELEQDDDRVRVIITPPTGITTETIAYVITGLVGLIVIIVGIVFIKKKVLIK